MHIILLTKNEVRDGLAVRDGLGNVCTGSSSSSGNCIRAMVYSSKIRLARLNHNTMA